MQLINNIPHYSFKTLQNTLGVSDRTLERWQYPVKIKDPSDRRRVLYNFNKLKPKYQQKIIAALGDPHAIRSHLSEKQIKILTGNFTSIGRACGCSQGYVVKVLKGEVNYSGPKARAIRKKAGLLLELLTP